MDPKGTLAALLAAVAWATTGIFVRLLPGFSPREIVLGRLFIALGVTVPFLWWTRRGQPGLAAGLARSAMWVLAALMTAYYLLAVAAFQLAPVGEVALLISTSPVFVLGYRRLRGRRTTSREVLGAVLAMAGAAVITLPGPGLEDTAAKGRLIGDILALLGAAAMATYAVTYRIAEERGAAPHPIEVAVVTCSLGTAALLGWVALMPRAAAAVALSGRALLVFFALGIVSTAVPTIAYAVSSRRLAPFVATTYRLFTPVFAGLLAALVLGESPSNWLLLGGALVLAGMAIALGPPGNGRCRHRRHRCVRESIEANL